MADWRCLNADILASLLLGNNEAFAREIIDLANRINWAKALVWEWKLSKHLEKQASMQINWIVSARILYWDAWDKAKQSLMKTIMWKWWTIWEWARLLELIDSISLKNLDEYAGLLFDSRWGIWTAQDAIDDFKYAVSNYVAAKNELKKSYWIKDKKLVNNPWAKIFNKKLSKEERRKALWELWIKDRETLKKWWVPTEIVSPDDQWKHIEKFTWDIQKKREMLFNNYILWRIFLWEDDDVLEDFIIVAKKFDNTLPSLTLTDIENIGDINTLISRVYTNALDIARNKQIRDALKLRLIQLIQSVDWDWIPTASLRWAISVVNTMMFSEAWLSFSTALKYNNIWESVRNILVDEKWISRVSRDLSNESIFKELKKILWRDKFSIGTPDNPKMIEAFWTKISWDELLKIIYAASWDNEVKTAIEAHSAISREIIIDFAKAKLFWLDSKNWEKNLRKLIEKFSKPYDINDVSTIAFKATSWKPVKPTNPNNIAFINFKKSEEALNVDIEDSAYMSRARFNDSLAELYTLTVSKDTMASYDISDWVDWISDDVLKNLEYIVIPNSNRSSNFRLKQLKERMEKLWNKNYIIVYPKSRQSWQYFVDTDWRLKFKTTDKNLFWEMSSRLAIDSFNSATINLTENTAENRMWNQLSNLEKKIALDNSALEFFRWYMWTAAEWLSNEQLIRKISDMTWIPISPDWSMDWWLAQLVLFNNYTASWRYVKDIVTADQVDTIISKIRNMSNNALINDIWKLWFTINQEAALRNIELIREAYIWLSTTSDLTEYVWYKWLIQWLSNKWVVTDLSLTQFRQILTSNKPLAELSTLFFWDREVTEAEMNSLKSYLWDILDSYIAKTIDNLTKAWYQIPMLSPNKALLDYLKWNVNTADQFIQAFIYKNWLSEDYNLIKQIFDDYSPTEIWVRWLINKESIISFRESHPNRWTIIRALWDSEMFLPTTYNSYSAVMGKMDMPNAMYPVNVNNTPRLTRDEVRNVLRQFFTDEELEWVSINFYDSLIDWIWEGKYTSDWMRRALNFINNPEEATPYHESVHMYIDMFLNDDEKKNLFNDAYAKYYKEIEKYSKEQWYEWLSVYGKTEEWIAENFIKFVKWGKVKLDKKTKNLFQRIWDTIKSWFNKVPEGKLDSLNQFYSDIYNRVRPEGWIINREWWLVERYMVTPKNPYKTKRIAIPKEQITTKWITIVDNLIENALKKSGNKLVTEKILKQELAHLENIWWKSIEIDILRDVLENTKIHWPYDLWAVREQLSIYAEPLKYYLSSKYSNYNFAKSINIDAENVHIYTLSDDTPFKKFEFAKNSNHYNPNDFQLFHVRHYDTDDGVYKIIETQSDFFQSKGWESNAERTLNNEKNKKQRNYPEFKNYIEFMSKTRHKRAIQEEIYTAIANWYKKLQFPTNYEIAAIESYAEKDDIIWPGRIFWTTIKVNWEDKIYLSGMDSIVEVVSPEVFKKLETDSENDIIVDKVKQSYNYAAKNGTNIMYWFDIDFYDIYSKGIISELIRRGKIDEETAKELLYEWYEIMPTLWEKTKYWTHKDFQKVFDSIDSSRKSLAVDILRYTKLPDMFRHDTERIVDIFHREWGGKYIYWHLDYSDFEIYNELDDTVYWWGDSNKQKFNLNSVTNEQHLNVLNNYKTRYEKEFKKVSKEFWLTPKEVIWDDWLPCYEIDLTQVPLRDKIQLYRRAQQVNWPVWNHTLTEDMIIQNILTKYEEEVERHIKDWTMTVKLSQDLKQQASYALNTATQDLILKRYWDLLSPSDREWLLWMWFNLKLATNTNELNALKQANAQSMWNFRKRWWELAQTYNTSLSSPEELNKKLMESWKVYVENNWQQAIVNVWDELEKSIKSIPDTAWDFAMLKNMSKSEMKWLNSKQAFTLLKTIDLVKNNITRGNFYSQLMYQLNPQLRRAENWLNFFQTFKTVDMWWWIWVPWALTSNNTAWYVEAWKAVEDNADIAYKASITKSIYNNYIKVGKELKQEDLVNIVNKVLKSTNDVDYAQHYIDAFAPYVSLKWLSPEVVTYINNLLNTEAKDIQDALRQAWADLDWVLEMTVILDDGSVVKVWDMINWNVDWWQQRLFWWLSNNWEERYFVSPERTKNVKEELKWAYAWYNDVNLITNNEAAVITQILWNARKILQRDTNTNKFIEFDNAIWWQNDILKQLMEIHLFWWWKYWKRDTWVQKSINTISKWVSSWLNSRWFWDLKKWWEIQSLYETYYSRSLAELKKMQLPEDWTHQIALELAKYFKELELRLGSKNWATWVSMDTAVNRAFWNLWGIIRNIHSKDWIYSLMNKIWNNQVLWLFKFTKEWDASYNKFLKDLSTNNIWKAPATTAYLWEYKEFINWNEKEITQRFNTMFGSDFSESDVNIILQWLWWYKIVNNEINRYINSIWTFIASFWWRPIRMLMTYPFQLFTIFPQLFAYNVKADSFKRELWIESVWHTNDIRKEYWILEWTYVDFWWLQDSVRRYWSDFIEKAKQIAWRDSDEIWKAWVEFDDWVLWLYWKTTSYVNNNYDVIKSSQLIDSVRDNANNLIDAAEAQTFKWLAFLKALQKNDYIKFMNADAFKEFMDNKEISQAVKDRLLDRINIYSNRIFQDMLWTWFSWLDKAYWSWPVSDFLIWVLWLINFKWAWWTNIFRQTFEKIGSILKVWWNYSKWNKEVADEMWRYIVRTPEFTNLSTCLWWDLVMSWRLAKFQKNGKLPDDESEVELMDFVERVGDNISFVSQQWQWLLSFWWLRPFLETGIWMYQNIDKWILWSAYAWANAFISSLASNVWRNWKPIAFITDALLVAQTDWIWAWWDYVANNWHTLSSWTMRYMIEEWYTSYWANTALTTQRWGIPSLLVWEQYANSDTAFMYDVKNWNTSWFELLSTAINNSQALKVWANMVKSATQLLYKWLWAEVPSWAKSKKWVYTLLTIDDDLKESETYQELFNTWKPRPKTQKQLQWLLDDYLNPSYPWGYKAYKWLQNYLDTWTLNGKWKDKWNYYDKWIEQFYGKIEARKPWELKDFLDKYTFAYMWDPDSEEGRIAFYEWAWNWLGELRDDPDYLLYASAMYKWNLNNLYYEIEDAIAKQISDERKFMWFSKEQYNVKRSDIDKLSEVKEWINNMFLDLYYDEMYASDMELMQKNFYEWIADELEPEVANWYFEKQPEKNREGNETWNEEWVMKNNIKNQIRDEIFYEKAIADWRWEDALTYSAIMTQSLAYDDDTWLIRASMVDYYADRIINSDRPASIKQSAFSWLIHNNKDVFTYDYELVEKYWDYYVEAEKYKNRVLHNISDDVITNLNNMAISLHNTDDDALKVAKEWVSLSKYLSNLWWKLETKVGWSWTWNWWRANIELKTLAIPIKWLSAMGYKSPKKPADFNFEAIYKSKGYDPKTKTLWPITPPKKNKAIKSKTTRKMTQKEENELDLI